MLDWGPYYLKREAKHATIMGGGWSTLLVEFSGALGMLSMGWISDRFSAGPPRRGKLSVHDSAARRIFRAHPHARRDVWLDLVLFAVIGFLAYVPVMMLGVMSLDLTSKKAASNRRRLRGHVWLRRASRRR